MGGSSTRDCCTNQTSAGSQLPINNAARYLAAALRPRLGAGAASVEPAFSPTSSLAAAAFPLALAVLLVAAAGFSSSSAAAAAAAGAASAFLRLPPVSGAGSEADLAADSPSPAPPTAAGSLPTAAATLLAIPAMSASRSLVKGRGMLGNDTITAPFAFTSKKPLRGLSLFTLTSPVNPALRNAVSNSTAFRLNKPHDLHASI